MNNGKKEEITVTFHYLIKFQFQSPNTAKERKEDGQLEVSISYAFDGLG